MWEKPTSLSLHAGDPAPTECPIFPNQPADNQKFAPRNYTLKRDNTPAVSHGTRPFKTFFSWFINSYLIDFSNDLQGHRYSRWGPELQLIFIYFYCSSAVVFIFACFPCSTAPSQGFSSISNGLVADTLSSPSISSVFAVTLLTLC